MSGAPARLPLPGGLHNNPQGISWNRGDWNGEHYTKEGVYETSIFPVDGSMPVFIAGNDVLRHGDGL